MGWNAKRVPSMAKIVAREDVSRYATTSCAFVHMPLGNGRQPAMLRFGNMGLSFGHAWPVFTPDGFVG
jgi:hypothetical protein